MFYNHRIKVVDLSTSIICTLDIYIYTKSNMHYQQQTQTLQTHHILLTCLNSLPPATHMQWKDNKTIYIYIYIISITVIVSSDEHNYHLDDIAQIYRNNIIYEGFAQEVHIPHDEDFHIETMIWWWRWWWCWHMICQWYSFKYNDDEICIYIYII